MTMNPEDRQRLSDQIRDWNACRLQLFEISQPDTSGQFYGVIRFFFQEAGEKVATKCIRISNAMSTREIIDILVEKFRPDMRMLTTGSYALYEVHFSEERKLADTEMPLHVQLSWSKGDREGRFLLKNENEAQQPPKDEMKRKLSKREKKEAKKQAQAAARAAPTTPTEGKENKPRVGEMLYKEVPDTSFTRSISNPEAVMRRRRQQKLEKLQQVQRQEGGARGNIIKIFGEMIDPSIPYKTVLLSRQDTAAGVVRDMLIKYGREQDNPANYCLLLVQLQPTSAGQELQRVESVLQDNDSPLVVAQQLQPEYIRFEICPRHRLSGQSGASPQRPQQQQQQQQQLHMLPQQGMRNGMASPPPQQGQPLQRSLSADLVSRQSPRGASRFPYLKELSSDGRDAVNGKMFILDAEVTDVGRMPHLANNRNIQLTTHGVQPQHCVLARMDGIVTVTPFSNDADTYVDNRRIHETTMLEHGAVVRFGRQAIFRFVDPIAEQNSATSSDKHHVKNGLPVGAVRVLPPNATTELGPGPGTHRSMSPAVMSGHAQSVHAQPLGSSSSQILPGHGVQLSQPQYQQAGGPPVSSERLDELPVSLVVGDIHEDRFLAHVIADAQSTNCQFRLAPAFVLYMSARFRLTNRYQPQPPVLWQDKPQKVVAFLEKVATTIRRAVQAKPADVGYLAFWLANSSELFNFLRCDLDLAPLSESSRSVLSEAVQMSFHYLINAVHLELNKAVLPSFFADNDDDFRTDPEAVSRRNASTSSLSSGAGDVVQLLTVVMSLSRRCRINAGLTIQLFSHWFHFINHRIFNTLIQSAPRYCTRAWGSRLLRRLNAVHAWAEKNGLELAVDTHLERARQATVLLEAAKDSPSFASNIAARCFRLNSLQVKALLDGCARAVAQGLDTAHLSRHFVETLLLSARQTADEALRAAGFDVVLYEREDLNARFLMPDDGYASDSTKDIPPGLQDFLQPLIRDAVCGMNIQQGQGITGSWTVYFTKKGAYLDPPLSETAHQAPQQAAYSTGSSYNVSSTTPNRMSQHLDSHPPHSPSYQIPAEPQLYTVQLQKIGNSLGLSIVAAKGDVNKQRGIYVKSVVPNGAAYVDGRIKEGDQLVEVDGRSLQGLTQESAAERLVNTGQVVSLLVAKQAAMYHGVAMLLGQANLPNQPLPYSNSPVSPVHHTAPPVFDAQQQQYNRPEYARPRSHHEEQANNAQVGGFPQQALPPGMSQSFSGNLPLQQQQSMPIQRMPVQNEKEYFNAPSYENWSQSQIAEAVGGFPQQQQPQIARMTNSVPNLIQQQQPPPPQQLQPPQPQQQHPTFELAPIRELLPPALASRVFAADPLLAGQSSLMPKVDMEPERLQPSFYTNTTPLQEQRPRIERMVTFEDDGEHMANPVPYQPPHPERRMLVPLPQIPQVDVKAKDSQPEFFRPLRGGPAIKPSPQQQQLQQPHFASSPPSRPPVGNDSNYMHLSDLASAATSHSRTRLSSTGSNSSGPLLQQPVRQPVVNNEPPRYPMSSAPPTSSTFSTTIGPRASESDHRRLMNGKTEESPKAPSPTAAPPSLLVSARRNKDEIAELESRAILTQAELERLRHLRIGSGDIKPSIQQPQQQQQQQQPQSRFGPSFYQPSSLGDTNGPQSADDLENRRSALQTQSYHRDVEGERRREEEIEHMRVQKEMDRINLRKHGSPTPPITTASARLVTSTYSSTSNYNNDTNGTSAAPQPTSALAGGILSGSYTVSSPASSPKVAPKNQPSSAGMSRPAPPPVAPKPFTGPRPYKPSVAPKPAMSSSVQFSAPLPSWRNQQSPSPPPPPLPSSPPPSDLPDEFDRRHMSPPSGVIGKGEVYRDPRDRILQERAYYDQDQQHGLAPPNSGAAPTSASRLTFHDKMRLFAHEAGEITPKDRAKASKTQLQIEAKLQH